MRKVFRQVPREGVIQAHSAVFAEGGHDHDLFHRFNLDGHRGLYGFVRIVPLQLKIFIAKGVYVFDAGVNVHRRQWPVLSAELQFDLIDVVVVDMNITKGMHEVAHR